MDKLKRTTDSIVAAGRSAVHEHPTAVAVGATGVALLMVPVAGPAVLSTIGFSASGPVALSTAAGWHASIGLVQGGSLFAFCQSAAMGGGAAGTLTTVGGLGAGVTGSAIVGSQWSKIRGVVMGGTPDEKSEKRDDNDDNSKSDNDNNDANDRKNANANKKREEERKQFRSKL